MHESNNISLNILVNSDIPRCLLACSQLFLADDRLNGIQWMSLSRRGKHLEFVLDSRIAEAKPHKKTIELSFWKWERAFMVDRILCRDHQERRVQIVSRSINGDSRFGHGFEQCSLSPRRR